MIAIQSNKELYFPDGKGFVKMEMDLITNKPYSESYEMRIVDSCYKEVEEEYTEIPDGETEPVVKTRMVTKQIGKSITRFKTMSYAELDALCDMLDVDSMAIPMREKINESFRQGLLLVTQQECLNSISGEYGKGSYYSEAKDWEIV